MTIAVNPTTYGQLLVEFQPQVIETSEDYHNARIAVLNLLKKGQLNSEEKTLVKLLTVLMREYDLRQPLATSAQPNDILEHLIESQVIDKRDLAIQLGGEQVLSEMVNGSRNISSQQAQILAQIFNVSPNLFITNKS
jgi:HTH-type transcriptional regulator / antitoxin HigA